MIVYFADRNLNVQALASTELPRGYTISDDSKSEELESGTATFTCKIECTAETRLELERVASVGNFLLRSHEGEQEFYNITETTFNTGDYTLEIYAEDAGLDLLNTTVDEWKAPEAHTCQWYIEHFINGTGWEIGIDEMPTNTLTLSWDGDGTLTERLLSVASSFNCEIGYSYEVDGLRVTHRYVDVYERRGNNTPEAVLLLHREIESITTRHNFADVATAYDCVGNSNKITLDGCNWSSDGTTTHDPAITSDTFQIVGKQVRCVPAMEQWASAIDPDGLIVKPYNYETDKKKELFSHAVAELKKVAYGVTEYDIEFNFIPEGVRLGDRVYISDDSGEFYAEARILTLTRSVTNGTASATLGDYVLKTSGISATLQSMAGNLRTLNAQDLTTLRISSTAGTVGENSLTTTLSVTIYRDGETITDASGLEDGESLQWYLNGVAITGETGFTLTVTTTALNAKYTCQLIGAD